MCDICPDDLSPALHEAFHAENEQGVNALKKFTKRFHAVAPAEQIPIIIELFQYFTLHTAIFKGKDGPTFYRIIKDKMKYNWTFAKERIEILKSKEETPSLKTECCYLRVLLHTIEGLCCVLTDIQ